ncbi:MAG TPA: hypothetical protein VFH43_12025, partial [Candidatus Kapabacteria bacterium]|nr:hypothetical protein [Candidatus Kapabacteria bacterium]
MIDAICFGENATGFAMAELPYYAANGRAYFDHGNGFLHPNPYDLNSPNIYFQFSTWLIGAFNKVTGIDPGVGMALLGFIFAVLAARVTYSLVALRLAESKYTTLAYFVVMFAGGLFTVRALIEMLIGTAPNQTTQDGLLTAFEP